MSETGEHGERQPVAASRPPVDPDVFSAAWTKVEPRLFSHLVRRRGLSDEAAADVCQEVALRAVLYRVQFRIPTELFRWGLIVGNRLATVLLAESERWRTEPLPTTADAGDLVAGERAAEPFDVEANAAARWAWHTALAEASEADLRALRTLFRTGEAQPVGKRERDRLALQLHRARKRLRARLDELGGLAALGAPGVRRLLTAFRRVAQARTPLLAAVTATVAGGVLGGFTVGGAGLGEKPSAERPLSATGLGPSALWPGDGSKGMADRLAAAPRSGGAGGREEGRPDANGSPVQVAASVWRTPSEAGAEARTVVIWFEDTATHNNTRVEVYCTTPTREAACDAIETVSGLRATGP